MYKVEVIVTGSSGIFEKTWNDCKEGIIKAYENNDSGYILELAEKHLNNNCNFKDIELDRMRLKEFTDYLEEMIKKEKQKEDEMKKETIDATKERQALILSKAAGMMKDTIDETFKITEQKEPFPELEDIDTVKIEAPKWGVLTKINKMLLGKEYQILGLKDFYSSLKDIHENSLDFKVTWELKQKCTEEWNGHYIEATQEAYDKLIELGYKKTDDNFPDGEYYAMFNDNILQRTNRHSIISNNLYTKFYLHNGEFTTTKPNPHAEIKAEYEKAIAEGKIVKLYARGIREFVEVKEKPEWIESLEYELRYYEIDWKKLLAWSYANDEFLYGNDGRGYNYSLAGFVDGLFISKQGAKRKDFILSKTVEIKDEWLKEIK